MMMVYATSLLLLTFSVTNMSSANSAPLNGGVSPQRFVTDEEWQEMRENTITIVTPFGEYERASSALPFHPSEVVYNSEDANAKTKQIFEDGGVFVQK